MASWAALLLSSLATASDRPERVISLDLCSDWLLAHYAEPSQILALSPLSASYKGPIDTTSYALHDGSLEQLISLNPDLIVVGQYNAWLLRERLTALGYPVKILTLPQTLAAVDEQNSTLLSWLSPEQPYEAQYQPAPPLSEDAPLLLKLGSNGIATGLDTFENQLLEQIGFRNYSDHSGYAAIDLEGVIASPPDRLLIAAPQSPALANLVFDHPIWKQLLKPQQIYSSDDWRWQCPGPWTFKLIEELRAWR
ncbi:iron complex transport system substrate-binding protein [Umboniibacter marinipuniceus]|uniref:Iron complex transport system substrate-binding protein n=1 Tax=Umboniibacter marinipuniceus TaxID=569599 RepID=A0A3M0ACW2_9GAMM|nr:iron complex transport system substrate-binding protein [Umboniibacter marinipuniceus]